MPGKRDITVSKAETFLETQYFIPKLRRMFTSEKSTEYSFRRELGILNFNSLLLYFLLNIINVVASNTYDRRAHAMVV